MKKLFAALISTVTALSCLCVPVSAKIYNGWTQEDGNWRYYINGERVTGEQIIADKTYYFDENGNMVDKPVESKPVEPKPVETPEEIKPTETPKPTAKNGWISDNSGWHVYKNDQMIKDDWYQDKSKWYYLDENGVMVTGWEKISNKWYYFDTSGAMITGWKMIDNSWYYFKSSGEMHTGWLQVKSGDPWYYLLDSGKMVVSRHQIGNKTYCFSKTGEMLTGGVTEDGFQINSDGTLGKYVGGVSESSDSSSTSTSTPPSTVSSYSEQQAYKDAGIVVHKLRNALKNPNSLILTLDTQSLTHCNNGISIIGITYSAMNGFGGYNTSIYLAYVYNGKAYAAGYTNEIDSLIQESRGMSGTTYKLDNEKILTYEP